MDEQKLNEEQMKTAAKKTSVKSAAAEKSKKAKAEEVKETAKKTAKKKETAAAEKPVKKTAGRYFLLSQRPFRTVLYALHAKDALRAVFPLSRIVRNINIHRTDPLALSA